MQRFRTGYRVRNALIVMLSAAKHLIDFRRTTFEHTRRCFTSFSMTLRFFVMLSPLPPVSYLLGRLTQHLRLLSPVSCLLSPRSAHPAPRSGPPARALPNARSRPHARNAG